MLGWTVAVELVKQAKSVHKMFIQQPPLQTYEGRTESHEKFFLHANWEQQTKESAVVDGTSCCVIL